MTLQHAPNLTANQTSSPNGIAMPLHPTTTPAQAVADLIAHRTKWETGTQHKSNDELYDILAGCLGLYLKLVGSPKLAKGFRDYARQNGFKFKDGMSMEGRIARMVFSEPHAQPANQNRVAAYARVIKVGAINAQTQQTLKAYINSAGGIEQIRRAGTGKNHGVVSSKNAREIAENRFFNDKEPKLVDPVPLHDDLKPPAGQSYSAALVQIKADGTGAIVYGTTSTAAVNKLLELAGRGLVKMDMAASVEKQVAKTQEAITASSAAFVQELASSNNTSTNES